MDEQPTSSNAPFDMWIPVSLFEYILFNSKTHYECAALTMDIPKFPAAF